MDLGLKDKVAWVAGASRGIGLAIARGLAAEGCRVAISARSAGPLNEAAARLQKEFGADRVAAFAADVSVDAQASAAVAGCLQRWGRLDAAAINAGTGRIPGGASPSDADWDLALSQNLRGPICAARHAAPALKRQGGAITVIGSIAGLEAFGAPVAYSSAKAALHAWMKALSRDLAKDGVRVNAVIPGNIDFPGGTWELKRREAAEKVDAYIRREVPMARFGTPEEISDAVAFLSSPRAAFITGAALVVDGGQTRSLS
jgi:3-oxoacyl-[acyl-carrier protein] reductase